MREQFIDAKFTPDSEVRLGYCNRIIGQYMAQGYRLTLRQLYYQLVSANLIPNTVRSYKNLGTLASKARMVGLMDWDAIEDRGRQPKKAPEWKDARSLMDSALSFFRLPRLQGQEHYVELWVEKDALAGVLEPISRKFHVVLMVNKGYSSSSAMYESSNRIIGNVDRYGCEEATILYLGDMDPSGEDMVRDIQDRMDLFGAEVQVEKLALNMDQVQQFNLPPNPAKLTDSRAKKFIAKYGNESWEVDAIPPRDLRDIIEEALFDRLDLDQMNVVVAAEDVIKRTLREAVEDL